MNKNLSVVYSVYNSEKYLEESLQSVETIAREIVVVDHKSTDATVEIAKRYTKKVFIEENNPKEIDIQKNNAFAKATGEWILSLDGDEVVTKELAKEIEAVLAIDTFAAAYEIPRKNIIFGKWIQHSGWYPDYQVRLFRRGKGRFTKKHVHEDLTVEGVMGRLVNPLYHYNYQTVYQFIHRHVTLYAPNEAEAILEKGYTFSYADALRFPVKEFLSRYFAREGYKDGFYGLVISLLMAFYHFTIFAYLWEKKGFPDDKNYTKDIAKEAREDSKELLYWINTQKIDEEKNSARKIFLKAKRKLSL